MTRLKELQRIENAIKNGDIAELQWGVWYCEMRLKIATMKQHEKHWNNLLRRINTALRVLNEKNEETKTI